MLMLAVQVLEKIPYTEKSYPQGFTSGEIALMWINGMIWKIKNPNIPLVLYTDIETLELLKSYNITDSWDRIETDLLENNIGINKSIFWSNSKFRVYKELTSPFLFIDCDILIWDDISEWDIFEYELVTSYKEELTIDCYIDPNIMTSEYQIGYSSDWKNMALNASFVYINNKEFKKNYVNIAIDWMIGCSINEKNLNKYSVYFIEQRFLSELAIDSNINQKTLLSNFNTGKGWNYSDTLDGLWTWKDSYKHIYHIGYDKIYLRKGTKTYNEDYLNFFINYITKNCKERGFESLIPRFLELTNLF
jgi:hypothetical protein